MSHETPITVGMTNGARSLLGLILSRAATKLVSDIEEMRKQTCDGKFSPGEFEYVAKHLLDSANYLISKGERNA